MPGTRRHHTERNHQENSIGLGKNMAAEVVGLPLPTVAVWNCFLALLSYECKPRPPACYRGTTRLQLCNTLKRIFKCLLINWALWCAVSVCSLHVFWCPCQIILQSVQSELSVCTETSTCLPFLSNFPCWRYNCWIYAIYTLSPNWIDLKAQSTHGEGSR